MLPSDLLISRQEGETIIPKKIPLNPAMISLANEHISCFRKCVTKTSAYLNQQLLELEGDSPDYKIKRGFAHLLKNSFSTWEIISPLEPKLLRKKVFAQAEIFTPIPSNRSKTLEAIAFKLTNELNREVLPSEIEKGLYADLPENRILTHFETPSPESLIHRYNLSQVQGIFYRACQITINAHRNEPGEYKLLFRYLKLFQLMFYIEGDADTGFSITIDGPNSIFKVSTRYGLSLAKMIPALLHVSKWSLKAELQNKDFYTGKLKTAYFALTDNCDLVTHYPNQKTYDSMLEESFAQRWSKEQTPWKLEREVNLVPLPGSVMIPDFRLIHPEKPEFLLEIIGYWRPEYLKKKFYQLQKANLNNIIIAISERLNLEKAGINFNDLNIHIVWFKDKLLPKQILTLLEQD